MWNYSNKNGLYYGEVMMSSIETISNDLIRYPLKFKSNY